MDDYENIQIARRVSRLIEDTERNTFPLITLMFIILMAAIVIVSIREIIYAI